MTETQAVILGVLQGAGEFLPISSSAHLALAPRVFGWPYQGLAYDVMLHLGTLLAVMIYFWRDWLKIFSDALKRPSKRKPPAHCWPPVSRPGGGVLERHGGDHFPEPALDRVQPALFLGPDLAGRPQAGADPGGRLFLAEARHADRAGPVDSYNARGLPLRHDHHGRPVPRLHAWRGGAPLLPAGDAHHLRGGPARGP